MTRLTSSARHHLASVGLVIALASVPRLVQAQLIGET
jgi:hypothetical protein